ncbi:MAG: hypothetical protein ACAH83_20495 [Alphaproteobacteria bacterium]
MSSTSFNIPASIRNGYLFVVQEWQYLARFSLLPFGITLITSVLMYHQRREFSIFEDFLWNAPAYALLGWFLFLEARLLLLGERASMLPDDPAYTAERRNAMWACIAVFMLFIMGYRTLFAYLVWGFDKKNAIINFFWLFLIGAGIWAIRFAVAYILAAVNYPIRRYIFQVNGIFISLRLAGLYFLTVLPLAIAEYGLTTMILPEEARKKFVEQQHILMNLPESTAVSLMTVSAVSDILGGILATAAFAYALKDMLGRPRQEKAA